MPDLADRFSAAYDELAETTRDLIRRLRAAEHLITDLRIIEAGSPPNDWEERGGSPDWLYLGYGHDGDADAVDSVDHSNIGDVHSHGQAVGRWRVSRRLRDALATYDKEHDAAS